MQFYRIDFTYQKLWQMSNFENIDDQVLNPEKPNLKTGQSTPIPMTGG